MDWGRHLFDLAQGLIAGIGGVIAALMRKEAHNPKEIAFAAMGAVFLGFIIAKMCRVGGFDEDVSTIITALSGWIGADRTTAIIETFVKARVGAIIRETEDE